MDRAVTLIESTSPSGLLTASLDASRSQNAVHGEELLAETIASLDALRDEVRSIDGLDVLDEGIAEHSSVSAWDPLRLTVDVRGTGATGHAIAEILQDDHNVWPELYAENVVVAVFGIGEAVAESGARLLDALRDAAGRVGRAEPAREEPFAPPPPWGPTEMTPRQAFLGPQEVVGFDAAEGRIASETLAAYPPGVPNVLPGERLTRATLDYIAD
jgi:lysine decarboxylase